MMHDPVSAWLENLGLGRYSEAFQHNAINWDVLPELNEGDLEALGVLLDIEKHSCARSRNCHQALKVGARGLYPLASLRNSSHSLPNASKPNGAS